MAAQDTPRIEEPHRTRASIDEPGSRETTRAAGVRDRADLAAWSIVALLGIGGFALMTVLVAWKTVFPFDQPHSPVHRCNNCRALVRRPVVPVHGRLA